jgi:hypothetical protein
MSRIALLLALSVPAAGCDMARFTASQSLGLVTRGSAAIQEHWDPELVGDAMPASILQLEGLYATVPDDERVSLELLRAYLSYAYGWIEDEAERAEVAGDLERQEALLLRAKLFYLRARNIGLHHLRLVDPGIDDAIASGPSALEAHLRQRFTSRTDAPILMWTGYAWGSAINVARDDPELLIDLATARILVERAVELDEPYFEHGGVTFLAAMAAAAPETSGGDPERGRELFERALTGTNRTFFPIHVQYAGTYAVTTGNRALYIRLLREVIDGGDPRAEVRLANRLARRRAIRMLQRVDEIF